MLSYTTSATNVFGDWRLPPEAIADPASASRLWRNANCSHAQRCTPGLILPMWSAVAPNDPWAIAFRAIIYGSALAYLLFGVSIVTDRIVSCCEVMASHKKSVTIKLKSGGTTTVQRNVWHPVVASLTFGVTGTSSPEILLPVVDIFNGGFQGDQLGPALIVGSGAYHLFLITSICLLSVRDPNGRPIKDLHLFLTTAAFAILAYLWVYFIIGQISPGIIELWEALLTLAFFPVLVLSGWIMSKRLPQKLWKRFVRWLHNSIAGNAKHRNVQAQPKRGQMTRTASEDTPTSPFPPNSPTGTPRMFEDSAGEEEEDDSPEAEKRRKLAALMQKLRKQYPQKSQQEIAEIAQIQMLEETGKSAAFYRLQATGALSGNRNAMALEKMREKMEEQVRISSMAAANSTSQVVGFNTALSTCQESCRTAYLTVNRSGAGVADTSLTVDYETVDGTARANVNYVPSSGRLIFTPAQQKAEISVQILDDGIYEETAKFFEVKLINPRFEHSTISRLPAALMGGSTSGRSSHPASQVSKVTHVELPIPVTKVSILDDDHCGVFAFERQEQTIADNCDVAQIKVLRNVGTKGRIAVSYRITAGTAKAHQDYEAASKGTLRFEEGQAEAVIEVKIIDKNRYGEVYTFFIELQQSRVESTDLKSTIGMPAIGEPRVVQIGICEDEEMEQMLDRLLKMTDLAEFFTASSWRDQISDAFTVYHDSESKAKCPLIKGYLIHFISFPWKFVVALLPPAHFFHGWVAYASLICLMGFIAALIGDCARHLGCTIGLKDTVTAITLIPLGMGLPDTFASHRAAKHELTADAAIGQITASNAASVFLGMGMAWTVGAAYRTAIGDQFKLPPADFGFSVMLYCTFAFACILVLLLRRLPPVRGELGGPFAIQILSALFLILLWLVFATLTSMDAYCVIKGFIS